MSRHIISLYDDHDKAVAAVALLKQEGFNEKHISLLGMADVGDEVQVKDARVAARGVGIGALVGVLAGIGLAAIPGIGILYGLGAVAGAVAGFDFGVIGGTIISALAIGNMGKEVADRYAAELKAGKTLLAFSGDDTEIGKARGVLEGHGMHTELLEH
ncbi:hypothetical protein [Taibaiella koreensis]|uniref:hypothetical protein n=1 Tax=Taibaiella koreensis TaxID=1268548 RepID=UPI000E5A07CA|nr:hypothetical protein [Taibaiella koreensis]